MASSVVPRSIVTNTQPRHPDGRFAPITPHITKRAGVNRLAGIVQRALDPAPVGSGVVHVKHEDDRSDKRLVLK